MKFGVVTEVSIFLVITQVSIGFNIFSSLANISTFMIASSANVKSCVMHCRSNSLMFGPVQSHQIASKT